jgi:glutamate-1-semialdehyde aminotransferase/spore coat polysaccharide biosynthesis protein SpsF (cytidylyltransferase family)
MEIKNNTSVIIQARFNANRFKGKVLKRINGKSILEILVTRLKKSKKIDGIIVACPNTPSDKKIINECKKLNIKYFQGPEENVLKRFFLAAKKFKIKNIIRITADCPFVDPMMLDEYVSIFHTEKCDYLSNTITPTYPDGFDIEIFNYKSLKERYFSKNIQHEKEHVTYGIMNLKKYKKHNISLKQDYSKLRLTLDTKEDFIFIDKIFKKFNYDFLISFEKIINFYKKNKFFFKGFNSRLRNIGLILNKGQKTWIRANEIIPGGTMLFSKNPDLHLPKLWPAYFSKAKGCNIWDLEGKKFIDLHLMGVGTNTLGYCNKHVDSKVVKSISNGNMTSLNSIEEIELSEKLIELHPWSEMARFTRSGGEANSVAVRIARAYSGKDNIAICGYHGWHDWYLSSNLSNKNNLNDHLMKSLNVSGVPRKLKNTTYTFEYNNFTSLKNIVDKHEIGVIKLEVERNIPPKNDFLKKIRNLCDKKNIILIFDECTSGFRANFGGLHLKYGVNPDIAVFGKALGNGYAINAIIGKKDIMNASNKTFISSTFWTEKIGSTAALETLRVMEDIKSWEVISKIGVKIKKKWFSIAKEHKLDIKIQGIDALPNFIFLSKNNNAYKTFISQEMIKKNILASNAIYTSISHQTKKLDLYFDTLNDIFFKISKCENESENIYNLLEVPIAITGIRNN